MGYNFISLFGILIILTVAWIFSKDRRNLNWRVIIFGTLIQIFIAVIIFRFPEMSKLFQLFNDGFNRLLGVVNEASIFIFGIRFAIIFSARFHPDVSGHPHRLPDPKF